LIKSDCVKTFIMLKKIILQINAGLLNILFHINYIYILLKYKSFLKDR